MGQKEDLAELMLLKDALEDLKEKKAKLYADKGEKFMRSLDEQREVLRKAQERHDKAVPPLVAATREYNEAIEDDQKAINAFMNNEDKDAESWLEVDVTDAAKKFAAAKAKYQPLRAEYDEAYEKLEEAMAKMDKLDAEDAEYSQDWQNLITALKPIQAKIAALRRGLRDNPKVSKEVKDALNKLFK